MFALPFRLLILDILDTQLIGDLQHVHALSVQLVLASKTQADIVFVTDNILEPTPHRTAAYGGRQVRVRADGKVVGGCLSLFPPPRSF